jgi:beta-glucosidase
MTAFRFMFSTGIENSYPTIDGGRTRVDEMEKCGHYKHWRTDFELLRDLDIRFLRYGPPIHRTWLGDGRHDWAFADETFGYLKGLCHGNQASARAPRVRRHLTPPHATAQSPPP